MPQRPPVSVGRLPPRRVQSTALSTVFARRQQLALSGRARTTTTTTPRCAVSSTAAAPLGAMYLDQVPAAATAVLVLALALGLTPPARALQHAFQVALAPPVTPDTILRARPTASSDPAVDEADEDAPLLSSAAPSGRRDCARPPVWVTATLSLTSLVHLSWYLGCWIASLASAHPHRFPAHYYAPVGAWVYVLVRTQLFIQPTPSYDSMVLLASLLLVPLSRLVASPSHAALASAIASLLLIGASLYVQLQLPIFAYAPAVAKALGIPLQHPAEKLAQASFDRTAHKFPAPDGVCTLWQWASNSWVDPLIKIGSIPNGPGLKEANIWNVATPTLTRYLMSVWDMFPKGTSIWWRIALVNRRDLTMDLTLTVGTSAQFCSRCFQLTCHHRRP